jgi:plastocyanin domain-containing protein
MRAIAIAAVVVLGLAGCDRTEEAGAAPVKAKPADKVTRVKAADGSTSIAIKVSEKGYQPAGLTAEAGERLTLVFTRTADIECARFVKVPGVAGQTELPVGQPIPIKLTMPTTGEVVFTCGMDMFRGVIKIVKR